MKLSLNRLAPFDIARFQGGIMESHFVVSEEDQHAVRLTEIDMEKVALQPLRLRVKPEVAHVAVAEALSVLRREGHIPLDAQVVEELLLHPEFFPQEWYAIADSDQAATNLCFYGTIFTTKLTQERAVLSPFGARGHWSYGWCHYGVSQEDTLPSSSLLDAQGLVTIDRYVVTYPQ